MGDWSGIEGEIRIRKDYNISLHKVVAEFLTDEFTLEVKTKKVTEEYYTYTIYLIVAMDVMWVCKNWPKFKKALKSEYIQLYINGAIY